MDGTITDGGGASIADAAPAGLLAIDAGGTVRLVNEHALTMLGRPRRRVVGRSVLEFVHDDDVDFALDLMVAGGRRPGAVAGPVDIRHVDANGEVHPVQLWSRSVRGADGFDGFVLTIVEASVGSGLLDAARIAVEAGPLGRGTVDTGSVDTALARLAHCVADHPLRSAGSMLVVRDGVLTPVGAWPLGSTGVLDDRTDGGSCDDPWHVARHTRSAVDLAHLDQMPAWLREACTRRGIAAVWCRPVVTRDGETSGVLVVWRAAAGLPSVNQARHLGHVVVVATLVLDQAAYRCSVERAAFTDPLTGLGNRARLE